MQDRLVSFLCIILLAFLISACGGGEGDTSTSTPFIGRRPLEWNH